MNAVSNGRIAALTTALVLCGAAVEAGSCSTGGGGISIKTWAKNTFTVEHGYDVANHFANVSTSVAGTALSATNSMLFDMVDFFSEQENLDDFTSGRAAISDINNSNQAGVRTGSAGFYGRKSGFTSEELAALGLGGG